ncbi:RNA polymerase sigma factor [Tautonia sociabilis]|uniref:Sigma-70 family RNA polymerase sigma factor n=1 Tax=Tautonia sociabilis TaxID=2080755 RepID=A0A432MPG2_9BACT|nr:RNA polymerase sigma factor [Tautonia sociabilis]RUL89149.1 sigma-70 family RNA polymerase sigma factor [Tautonia sociabilis]
MVRRPEAATLREFRRLFQGGSLAGLSEAELLHRFAEEGDEAAFEAIVRRLGPMVLGVCRRMLGDRHAADDAFQATFLVLARRAGEIRDGRRLGPWLFGVAHRVARRARSRELRRRAREWSEVDDLPGSPEGAGPERSEVLAALDDEIARLPEAQRRPIVLCYLSGLTIDQAADRLGIPVGTARSRLARGRDRLRSQLARRGFEGRSALMGPMLAAWTGRPSPSLPLVKQAVALAAGASAPGSAAAVGLTSAPAFLLAQGALRTMTLWKLSTLAAGIVPVVAFGGSIGLAGVSVPSLGPGSGLPAPIAAVAALDDDDNDNDADDEDDHDQDPAETRIGEPRRAIRVELRGTPDTPGPRAEVARIDRVDGRDLVEVTLRAEGPDQTDALKQIIAKLEAELARMKERLAEVEGRPHDEDDDDDDDDDAEQADRHRERVEELAELARRRAEEIAEIARAHAEEAARQASREAERARRQVEIAIRQAEAHRGEVEARVEEARRQAEGVAARAAEAVSQALEAAGDVEVNVEIQADDLDDEEGNIVILRRSEAAAPADGEGRRRIVIRRQSGDAHPAPPAPPEAPSAPVVAPVPPVPPVPPVVEVRAIGGDLERRLGRLEERLERLERMEEKIDRLIEALEDRR